MNTLKLTYFKPSGKFYSEGDLPFTPGVAFHLVAAQVGELLRKRDLPGLMTGHSPYIVYFEYNGVPHLVVPE